MTQYQKLLIHKSQDMMQELFEEINNYLGDQDKLVTGSPPSVSPPVYMEGERNENTQLQDTKPIDQFGPESQPISVKEFNRDHQHPISVNAADNERNLYYANQFQLDDTDETTCFSGGATLITQLDSNNDYEGPHFVNRTQISPGLPLKTNHSPYTIDTRTSTTTQQRQNSRHELSTDTRSEGIKAIPSSPLSAAQYHIAYSYLDHDVGEIGSAESCNISQTALMNGGDDHCSSHADGYQDDGDDVWTPTTTTATATASVEMEAALPETYLPLNDGGLARMDSFSTSVFYEDPHPGEKQQVSDGSLPNQLPFLTPIHRIGEPHTVILRTKMARDVGTHEDRINAYNNAFSHCIMARSDIVPWIKKQYSKGPPDLMLRGDYTPRYRKSSKCLLGIFKRNSKSLDPMPTVMGHSDSSKFSVSTAISPTSMESTSTTHPQGIQLQYDCDNYHPQTTNLTPVLQSISDHETYTLSHSFTNGLENTERQQEAHRYYSSSPAHSRNKAKKSKPTSMEDDSYAMISDGPSNRLKNKSSLSCLIDDRPPFSSEHHRLSPPTPTASRFNNSNKWIDSTSTNWSPFQQQSRRNTSRRSRSTSPPPSMTPFTDSTMNHHRNAPFYHTLPQSPPGMYNDGRIRPSEYTTYKKINRRRSSSQLAPIHISPSQVPPCRLRQASSHSSLRSEYRRNPMPRYANADTNRRRSMVLHDVNHSRSWRLGPLQVAAYPRQQQGSRLSKQQQNQQYSQALAGLCDYFHYLPRHVLFNYLQDAQGDFYLAQYMCMEDLEYGVWSLPLE